MWCLTQTTDDRGSRARLGLYTLEAKIGEGGMGAVYRARHPWLVGPAAIKLLPRDRAGADAVARFQREVQRTRRLLHPNIVSIFDTGRTSDGVHYYAMEYLDGLSLAELVAHDGPLPPGRVVHVLRQACRALAEAHAAGLVHRDVKPANLHLGRRGGVPDQLKVLDFGLSEELGAGPRASGTAASAGGFVGTPHYAAPEAVTRPDTVDGRTDLYSLGAVAYFLLTGTPVFDGETMLEVCSRHLLMAPEPPSVRLGAPVPTALEALVLACLEKQPQRRPASAAALERALANLPGLIPWDDEQAERWWRERAPAVLAGVAGSRNDVGGGACPQAGALAGVPAQ
jgi:eukaryotic-like serine/threonine-protein kinase